MNSALELRLSQAQQIFDSNDPKSLQYLPSVIKLIRSDYVENTALEITDPILEFCTNVINCIKKVSENDDPENRTIEECAVLIAQFILCIFDRIISKNPLRADIIASMIDLFDNQRNNIGLCSVVFLFMNRLSTEVLHLPKPQVEKLCKICCHILSHRNQYSLTIFSFTLSLISNLMKRADNMEWFIRNDLIHLLAELFNKTSSCSVSMCCYLVVILNQIAEDGKHIDALVKHIGFTLIKNCILLFVEGANTNDSHHQIVEIAFVYLLRVFVKDPKRYIQENPKEVTELLQFLFEALFSPFYINYVPDDMEEENTRILTVHFQTDQNVLMEYVMSLFALLCYNSEHPDIVQDATVSLICQRINTMTNMNVVLFLHQFLYFCIFVDPMLINVILQENNVNELIANLQTYPSEPLLTVFAKILHFNETGDDHVHIINMLLETTFPSLLINLLVKNNALRDLESASQTLTYETLTADTFAPPKDEQDSNQSISAKVQHITLDLLYTFSNLGYSLVLSDNELITTLLDMLFYYLSTDTPYSHQNVLLAGNLLLTIGKNSSNFQFFEDDIVYIDTLCRLVTHSKASTEQIILFFNLIQQYAIYGNLHKLVGNQSFIGMLTSTLQLLKDYSLELQQGVTNSSYETIDLALFFSEQYFSILNNIGNRMAAMPVQSLPILGDIFTFMEGILEIVVDPNVVNAALSAARSFIEGGSEDMKTRIGGTIRQIVESGYVQGRYNESCIESVELFLGMFS